MIETVLRHHEHRGMHIVVMDHGANALDVTLMNALRELLANLATHGGEPVLIASRHPSLFSPGWDLKKLADADRDEIAAFLRLFNLLVRDLFSYPGPTAAAINGHAVAGGCLLAMACDQRTMVKGRARIGLAEINLGVPVPAACVRMLRARLAPRVVEELVFGGDGCTAERACELGVVHRVAETTSLMQVAEQELGKVAARPRAAVVHTKESLFREVWSSMAADDPTDDDAFVGCWFAEDTHERIRTLARTLSR
jgi:enoyl-CoA hydratase/carnithine racemase